MISQRYALPQCIKRILLALITVTSCRPTSASDPVVGRHGYASEWAIHVPGGSHMADKVADDLGFYNTGQIGALENFYLLRRKPDLDLSRRSKREGHVHTRSLIADSRITWVEQQSVKRRVKRDLISRREENLAYDHVHYNDTHFTNQWYLYDSRTRTSLSNKLDLHVIPVWAKNITGKGVVVTIIDDGLESNHSDLHKNYDAEASYDFNDNDPDPFPRYDATDENRHGTRCAGEVAMAANNGKCGVGVAYNARIGGIRMLDGQVTDSMEAMALSFRTQHIHIFSASWGPADDGRTTEGPGHLTQLALEHGVTQGRGGRGVIYVWASGNGGGRGDSCDCDGYTGSIYTLSISSASQHRTSPSYAEHCSSTMAAAYSSGSYGDQKIVSADLHDQCTLDHTGTSAAAPLAAGILALALEANPELTWRDVQHLVAWTAEYAPLQSSPGWKMNGAGFWVNRRFGFGLLNAAALVNAADARVYKTVPDKNTCVISPGSDLVSRDLRMRDGAEVTLTLESTGCVGDVNEVNYLEHVQLTVDLTYTRRGDLQIFLTSPSGTEVTLLPVRPRDNSQAGLVNWPFLSVHTWGERAAGVWTVRLLDTSGNANEGHLNKLTLTLHGTKVRPNHVTRGGGRRQYNYDYNNVQNLRENIEEKRQSDEIVESQSHTNVEYQHKILDDINTSSGSEEDIDSLLTNDFVLPYPEGYLDLDLSDNEFGDSSESKSSNNNNGDSSPNFQTELLWKAAHRIVHSSRRSHRKRTNNIILEFLRSFDPLRLERNYRNNIR